MKGEEEERVVVVFWASCDPLSLASRSEMNVSIRVYISKEGERRRL